MFNCKQLLTFWYMGRASAAAFSVSDVAVVSNVHVFFCCCFLVFSVTISVVYLLFCLNIAAYNLMTLNKYYKNIIF